ncbi:MAG: hypothetical protein LAO51_00565 [Acidobacteriia bacterium]|nr:hypothetical protein [Terriglobia bacterium]
MEFPTNPDDAATTRARLISGLEERLLEADRLTESVRGALLRGDAESIETSRARLEALAAEFKVLVEELRRHQAAADGAPEDPRLTAARGALRATVARLARSSAISCGVLERMVTLRRCLLSLASAAAGESYLPTGRAKEFAPQGMRLRQRA